jgi:transposase
MLLIGYQFGITSERRLIEELRTHLAWRWFTGLTFDQNIPHHSTSSTNGHGRCQESQIVEQLFQVIVDRCVACGLVARRTLSVDGRNAPGEQATPLSQVRNEVPSRFKTMRERYRASPATSVFQQLLF